MCRTGARGAPAPKPAHSHRSEDHGQDLAGKPLPRRSSPAKDAEDLAASDERRELSVRLMNLRDEERRRISLELHETAGQTLAALKMTLARVEETAGKISERAAEFLALAQELAEQAVKEVRTVSYLWHPLVREEAGLPAALRAYVAGFADRSGIEVRVEIARNLERLPHQTEAGIFRIVQEALANIHRHSGSSTAAIRLSGRDGRVELEVEDNGRGLPPRKSGRAGWARAPMGVGIAAMRERAKEMGGALEIESAPGRWTRLRVILPKRRARAGRSSRRASNGGRAPRS